MVNTFEEFMINEAKTTKGNFAIQLAGKWRDGIDLPWANIKYVEKAIKSDKGLHSLTTWFTDTMRPGHGDKISIESVNCKMNGVTLEVTIKWENTDSQKEGTKSTTIKIQDDA